MTYHPGTGGRPPAPRRAVARRAFACLCLSLATLIAGAGCSQSKKPKAVGKRYADIGPKKNLPPYLKGSIFELTELANHVPYPVSSYGLVGQLRGTGDTDAPAAVRQWMVKEMVRRGFGDPTRGFGHLQPGPALASPDFAIVRVDAMMPPGARKGERMDVWVSSLPNETTSLAHGALFECDLKENGADPYNPSEKLDVWAKAGGAILVNPAYALEAGPNPAGGARASLRRGSVPNGGVVQADRPLMLMLRQPQHSVARAIEFRINERFQREADRPRKNAMVGYVVAEAKDEGRVEFYVPMRFRGDWERFAGVVRYLFLDNSVEFATNKAAELAEAAVKPKAPLLEISYCWEGLGAPALPFVSKLLSHPDPHVSFAAARAAAHIGDSSYAAQETLTRIASTRGHPYQLSAIDVLGKLPGSTALNQMLRKLLDAPEASVRVKAYEVLAANEDTTLVSHPVKRWEDREKFLLDLVPSEGPPLVYATQRGRPRLAIIGRFPVLRDEFVFTALGNRLSISTTKVGEEKKPALAIHYRDPRRRNAVRILSRPDVAELAARLGGEGPKTDDRLDFTYGEVLAILQAMVDRGDIVSSTRGPDGRLLAASFVLQEAPQVIDQIQTAPGIDDGRPQNDEAPKTIGMR
jgi:HEAT repeat protein